MGLGSGSGLGKGEGSGKGLQRCFMAIKYLLFVFTFIFWLMGCALLALGVWFLVDEGAAPAAGQRLRFFYTGAYILIACGAMIMLIGFSGCCGAIRESQCLLVMFFTFLLLIFGLLLTAGIMSALSENALRKYVHDELRRSVEDYNSEQSARDFMNGIQSKLSCCGYKEGISDYRGGEAQREALDSCGEFKFTGCTDALFEWLESNMTIIAAVGITIGVTMILGMVLSMMLYCVIREQYS